LRLGCAGLGDAGPGEDILELAKNLACIKHEILKKILQFLVVK
jgi:hypothetical protein